MKPILLLLVTVSLLSCGDYEDPYASNKGSNHTDSGTNSLSGTDTSATMSNPQAALPLQGSDPNKEPAHEPSSLTEQYFNALADHRLHKFSQYNSGGGGEGMQSTSWVDLCANGRYFFYTSSSVYINGNLSQDEKSEEGTWRISESDRGIGIVFRNQQGQSIGPVEIHFEDGKFFMGGERYLRASRGDDNGPQTCR